MTTTEPARGLAQAAQLLPKPSLRTLYAKHRAEFAGLDENDRAAYEELLAEESREKARPELLARRAADRWAMWCGSVPGRYADDRATPGTFVRQPPAHWLSRLDAAQYPDRIAAWLADRDARTLVLFGSTGTGKTHAAVAAGYAAAGLAVHVRFISQLDYLLALRPGGVDDPGGFRERYAETSLLVLDDLGAETEDATQFVRQEIVALLDARLREDRRQIITTNLKPARLADAFGDRTVSRLRDRAVILHLEGDDRRNLARDPW